MGSLPLSHSNSNDEADNLPDAELNQDEIDNLPDAELDQDEINKAPDTELKQEVRLGIDDSEKLNVVLDLDHTLLHTIFSRDREFHYKYITKPGMVAHYELNQIYYTIFLRPNVISFILALSQFFNLYIYTNGTSKYCELIMMLLIHRLEKNPFIAIYSRREDGITDKRLIPIGLDPKRTIVIDDILEYWPDDNDNVINIRKFVVTPCFCIEPATCDLCLNPVSDKYMDDTELIQVYHILTHIFELYRHKLEIDPNYDIRDDITEHNRMYQNETCYCKQNLSMQR